MSKHSQNIIENYSLPSTHKLSLSSYQILNDEVTDETEWEECTTISECNKWRKENLVKKLKGGNLGHLVITIKLFDENRQKTSEITFIDVVGFDNSFTERIMNGEIDVSIEEGIESDFGK